MRIHESQEESRLALTDTAGFDEILRDAFLAHVSHELRTPLTAIALRIDTLLIGALDDPTHVRSVLQGMQSSIHEEARLIEDLIDAGRTRTGQLEVERAETRLAPIVAAAISAVEPRAQKAGVRLQVRGLDDAAPTPVYADEIRLQQVFWNLISNAVKFTSAAGTVSIETAVQFDGYVITITDTGAGIEKDFLESVFDAFSKRDNNNAKGLGLAIAKHVVELHGGTISAASPGRDRGSSFTVNLPRAMSDPEFPA